MKTHSCGNCSKSLQKTLHRKKTSSMLSKYSWDNIAQVKTLYNVVQLAPDNITQEKVAILLGQHYTGKTLCSVAQEPPENIAHEKVLFNKVVILFGQHCTGKNFVPCCPRVSRKHYTVKNLAQCCLNTIETTLRR